MPSIAQKLWSKTWFCLHFRSASAVDPPGLESVKSIAQVGKPATERHVCQDNKAEPATGDASGEKK